MEQQNTLESDHLHSNPGSDIYQLCDCYALNILCPRNSSVEALIPSAMVFGAGPLADNEEQRKPSQLGAPQCHRRTGGVSSSSPLVFWEIDDFI